MGMYSQQEGCSYQEMSSNVQHPMHISACPVRPEQMLEHLFRHNKIEPLVQRRLANVEGRVLDRFVVSKWQRIPTRP
jgi:hypothetical protein